MSDDLQRQRFIREYREAWDRAALGLPDDTRAALAREARQEWEDEEAQTEAEDARRAEREE